MNERLQAAQTLADRLDPDPRHARHVTDLALALFEATADLHGGGPRERELLTAAGLVHDIGYSLCPDGRQHHKHSRDLILQHGIAGFTDAELRLIAALARYHRKAAPRPEHSDFATLTEPQRRTVTVLAALLRVADGLDRTHTRAVPSIQVEVRPDAVIVHLATRGSAEAEIQAATDKSDLFEATFGRPVRFQT